MSPAKSSIGSKGLELQADSSPDWSLDEFESDVPRVPAKEAASVPFSLRPKTVDQPIEVISTVVEKKKPTVTDGELIVVEASSAQPPEGSTAVEEGMVCVAKSLYEGPTKCECCINWIDKTAEEVEEAMAMTTKLHGDAALLTRQRNGHGGEDPFMLHSIVIQSPLLKKTLQKVLKSYPGVSPELSELTFEAPFVPLFHRWDELVEAGRNESSTESRKHIKVLCDVLEPEFARIRNTLRECRVHGVIKFESLWSIFRPGELIYCAVDGQECIAKLREASYVSSPSGSKKNFELQCEVVDFDGSMFGYGLDHIQLIQYRGTAHTKDLAAMPLELVPDALNVKARLIERGRKFEKLRGYNFKHYAGPIILFDQERSTERQTIYIDERVIVDTHAYYTFTDSRNGDLVPLDTPEREGHFRQLGFSQQQRNNYMLQPPAAPSHDQYQSGNFSTPRTRVLRKANQQLDRYGNPITPTKARFDAKKYHQPLTEEQLLICVPFVRGFLLRRKQWAKFCVQKVNDIVWNEDALESLVLPNDEKDLLLAFAEGQANPNNKFDDFIKGKGKGIVMLLSGPPGVGKTLTAEAVAESTRSPLYQLSAGELGTYSGELERNLKDVLDKCTQWDAILLLDEADVFLEERSTRDLTRNSMVSVFLRLLEYYEGIMFLTTNRVEAIDAAFESRIDVSFNYEELTVTSRRQIWTNFIMRLPEDERAISEAELDTLAEIELNGRQIKSAIKTATMLAARKKEPLAVRHALAVIELRAHLQKGPRYYDSDDE